MKKIVGVALVFVAITVLAEVVFRAWDREAEQREHVDAAYMKGARP